MTAGFDVAGLLRPDLPDGEARWTGDLRFNFVGGHNDPASVPSGGFAESAAVALARHGPALARYNLGGSPQGHLPLRECIAAALDRRALMPTDPSEILVTSGSLQALDLVNAALLAPGDAVVVEEHLPGVAEFVPPRGGIFLWAALPQGVDTAELVAPAAAAGVEFNPGAAWCVDPAYGARRMRLCFGHLPEGAIAEGIAALAGVVHARLS